MLSLAIVDKLIDDRLFDERNRIGTISRSSVGLVPHEKFQSVCQKQALQETEYRVPRPLVVRGRFLSSTLMPTGLLNSLCVVFLRSFATAESSKFISRRSIMAGMRTISW